MPDQPRLSPAHTLMNALVRRCTEGLAARLSTNPPALQDPHLGKRTPPSHYAHCSLALALYMQQPDSSAWEKALAAYLAIPEQQLGHHPFNRLLLLLLHKAAQEAPEATGRIQTALKRCPLSAAYPSNNWTLLAQLCRILETPQDSDARNAAVTTFDTMLAGWMTDAGGFIDYPAKPRDGRGATPIAYHHKALLLTTIAVCHANSMRLTSRLQTLLNWAAQWIDDAGLCGGFGRTNHGLFGDACLLASLTLLLRSGASNSEAIKRCMDRLLTRLSKQQREDGLIWLTPSGTDGWDSYMHLSVYDAWFAGILSWANAVPLTAQMQSITWTPPRTGLYVDKAAGLAVWRTRVGKQHLEAMLATTGQPPQGFSATQAELRYAGGAIFNLVINGKSAIPPPIRVNTTALERMPALAAGIPVFERRGQLYGLVDLSVSGIDASDTQLVIELEGTPTALSSSSPDKGFLSIIIQAFDWRLFNNRLARRRALRRVALDTVRCRLRIVISAVRPSLQKTLRITLDGSSSVNFLNPVGWSVSEKATRHIQGTPLPSSLPQALCGAGQAVRLDSGSHDFTHTLILAAGEQPPLS